jgi:cytochrome c peroxidase
MSKQRLSRGAVPGALGLILAGCMAAPEDGLEETEGVQPARAALTEDGASLGGFSPEAAINSAGFADSFRQGGIDRTNPFFQQVGANLRTCETCHGLDQGWTITAAKSKSLFFQTQGLAPLFMLHDAGSRPDADISTFTARLAAFGPTLVSRGLIRFTRNILNIPTPQFAVTAVSDPSGFSTVTSVLAFRRPTPTVNEAKVSSTGWNGGSPGGDVAAAVAATAGGAARLHSQRPDPLPVEIANSIRDFQLSSFFAQIYDFGAGHLDAGGAKGGPTNLAAQPFYLGINDIQGLDPQGKPFDRNVFTLFDAWKVHDNHRERTAIGKARAAIYRGQKLFNTKEFNITGVNGLNDLLGQATVRGTCSTCHNSPNVGGHSVFRVFDVGTANQINCSPALPLLTLTKTDTGEVRKVCDLARGQTSGQWKDVGAFRAPPLRGLAARAPYFHDGQASDLKDVIEYFQRRFNIGLSSSQKSDLLAFLRAL